MRQRPFNVIAALLLALPVPARLAAQLSSVGGTLEITVVDSSGAGVANVQLGLRNAATGLSREVTTDEGGFVRVNELAVATYEVRVNQAGFAPYLHTGIAIPLGQTLRLKIQLSPATLVQSVDVSAQPPMINPSDTTVTSTVDKERIEELPVRSRNALDFVVLAPGVSGADHSQGSIGQTPLAGSGFSFGGLRPRSNRLSIDGLDNNDEFSGSSRTELSPEIVQEFQVINNGLSAEYGGASGGSINVVTRTGSNQIHGDAFVFLQNDAFNAQPPFEETARKPQLTRYRAGLANGGPLLKDRTFYYVAVEQEHLRSESASDLDAKATSAINGLLSRGTYPGIATRGLTQGLFPTARSETEASAKINHELSERNSLMLRYAFTNNKESSEAFNTSGLADASTRGGAYTDDNGLAGSLSTVLGSKAVNAVRFQLARRTVRLRTSDTVGPEIEIAGVADLGRPYEGNSHHREDDVELLDTFALDKASHLLRMGGTVHYAHESVFSPDGFGAIYIFPTLTDFLIGRPDTFRQAFGNPNTAFGVTNCGAFFQDHWSATRQLTLDLGVRYDFEHLPNGFNQDTNNVSPRVGIAYSPWTSWVLRAGYGIFFDRYILANLNRPAQKNGLAGFEQGADGVDARSIFQQAAGGPLVQPSVAIRPSVFRADPRMATPYSQQANWAIEHLVATNLTLSMNYLFVRGTKLPRTRNINLLPPTILTTDNAASLGITQPTPQQIGRSFFSPARLDPALNDIYQIENSANSSYHGFSLSVRHRSEDLNLGASYTVSKTLDDASDFTEQPQNPFALRDERALSLNHVGQRFVLSALIDLPLGKEQRHASPSGNSGMLGRLVADVELAPILTLESFRPVNPLIGVDSNHNQAFPLSARPLGFGRNSLRSPQVATIDLRLLKSIYFGEKRRLDLAIESFNVLNHTNVSQINPFFGAGLDPIEGFARPIEALNPRQVQFSVDFEF